MPTPSSTTVPYADRLDALTSFLAMDVMERGMALAREGRDIVQMGVGEPDFDAPPEVVAPVAEAAATGLTHYTDSRGLASLREAIADDCHRRRGIRPSPDRIVVTNGSSPAIMMSLQVLVNPGDEVLVPTPHYPCYPNMIRLAGGIPVYIPTAPEDGYRIDVDRVGAAITPRTKALMLASPANPTGAVQPREVVEGLAALGIPILSDEIYDGLVYDGASTVSPLGMTEQCFVLDGFSKRYAMTGFRLGYVIAPEAAARPLRTLQQNLFISATHFVQDAGIAALEHGQAHLDHMHGVYARRRRVLLDGLRGLGFGIAVDPPGAFYVLADARHLGHDSVATAFDILDRAGVACGPGLDFGEVAEGFLRFSFATSEAQIREGLRRLGETL